jgi:hypothetical protein
MQRSVNNIALKVVERETKQDVLQRKRSVRLSSRHAKRPDKLKKQNKIRL